MELGEIVEKINRKEVQVKEIAKELGINPSTLQRRMKKEGYRFDKEADLWVKNDSAVHGTSIVKASKSEVEANAFNEIASTIEEKAPKSRVKASKSNSELDTIDMLLTRKVTSKKRAYRGFYFDDDILSVIDGIASGNKSDLVNEALRKVFKDKGLL